LKLTTSRYSTPSGASIHERGIEPDVVLPQSGQAGADRPEPTARDAATQAAVQYLRDRGLGTQYARR
jgi:C-terminal processing protease CtpA/Prc